MGNIFDKIFKKTRFYELNGIPLLSLFSKSKFTDTKPLTTVSLLDMKCFFGLGKFLALQMSKLFCNKNGWTNDDSQNNDVFIPSVLVSSSSLFLPWIRSCQAEELFSNKFHPCHEKWILYVQNHTSATGTVKKFCILKVITTNIFFLYYWFTFRKQTYINTIKNYNTTKEYNLHDTGPTMKQAIVHLQSSARHTYT